ncbi:MAG: cell division protein FtsK [Candidatus Cloacimonetes bacterium]|nr:cell division protein FtsK [Candidatus Cloacimonadota bacterium]
MKNYKKRSYFGNIYSGVFLAIMALLFFLSIIPGEEGLESDYSILTHSGTSFFDIITLNFERVDNLIGPFGAFFGFWFFFLTGQLLSYFIIISVFLIGLVRIFFPYKREYSIKAFSIIFLGFFLNISLLTGEQAFITKSGVIVETAYDVLFRIFSNTGTAIISIALLIGFLITILGTNLVMVFLRWLGRAFVSIFDFLTLKKMPKKQDKEALKTARAAKIEQEEKGEAGKIKQDKKIAPTITDHVEYNDDHNGILDDLSDEDLNIDEALKKTRKDKKSRKRIEIPPEEMNQEEYQKPSIEEFLTSSAKVLVRDRDEMEAIITTTSRILIEKLAQFGVEAEVVNVNIGPIITQYELKPAPHVKVSRFQALADDLSLAIKSRSIRVQAPIPGRGLIGIEVPNKEREVIYLKDIMLAEQMVRNPSKLAFALGKDIVGTPVIADLAGMPHLLIAGATGSGKSVCINSIICSLLFRSTPEELRLVLIDPKRIELSGYEGIPHLIQDVVSDSEEALIVLNWAVKEMERRYELLQHYNVRDINGYNKKIKELVSNEEKPFEETLPYIVIIIDEFADLIMRSGRDIEIPITRLAQLARAIGIHLVLATQRPSIKIITGLIKANFPSRIAFQVAQKIDSRVILDMNGAETLLGKGDMLFIPPTKGQAERIHGAFVSDSDIEHLIEYLRTQPKPEQKIEIITESEEGVELVDYDDELFIEAAKLVVSADTASVSMLQRHFKIGYARAGRLIDMLERAKIIGKYAGSKSREVTATQEVLDAYGIE